VGHAPLPGSAGGAAERLVWDRDGAIHAGGGRPTTNFAAFCGRFGVGWGDPRSSTSGSPTMTGAKINGRASARFAPSSRRGVGAPAWSGRLRPDERGLLTLLGSRAFETVPEAAGDVLRKKGHGTNRLRALCWIRHWGIGEALAG
jgi:hypothetical protein